MSRVFFAAELEGVATFWRIFRTDGIALGFTGHDRDLWLDGILHKAAPGMLPSSIRRTADLSSDSAEMQGVLSHDSISSNDLTSGRFDEARIEVGAVNWENLESTVLYSGTIGAISQEGASFTADLHSTKSIFAIDPIPRTSPSCRAEFCGPGCNLSAPSFTRELALLASDPTQDLVDFGLTAGDDYVGGTIRWIGGPLAGMTSQVLGSVADGLTIDDDLEEVLAEGTRALLREGCDHTLATCSERFGNAINFQGEPFLPGNDLLSRYPVAS